MANVESSESEEVSRLKCSDLRPSSRSSYLSASSSEPSTQHSELRTSVPVSPFLSASNSEPRTHNPGIKPSDRAYQGYLFRFNPQSLALSLPEQESQPCYQPLTVRRSSKSGTAILQGVSNCIRNGDILNSVYHQPIVWQEKTRMSS